MKQYKGLDVPEIGTELLDVEYMQNEYCNACTFQCENVLCENCIFDNSNLYQFKQWLKDKE